MTISLYLQPHYLLMSSSNSAENISQNNFILDYYPSFIYLTNSTYTPLTIYNRLPSRTQSNNNAKPLTKTETQSNTNTQSQKQEINEKQQIQKISAVIDSLAPTVQNQNGDSQVFTELLQNDMIRKRIQINEEIQMIKLNNQKKAELQDNHQQQQLAELVKLQAHLQQRKNNTDIPAATTENQAKDHQNQTPVKENPSQSIIMLEQGFENSFESKIEGGKHSLEARHDEVDSTFRRKIHEIGQSMLGIGHYFSQMHENLLQNSTYKLFTSTAKNEYLYPLQNTYRSFPQALTDAKFELIKGYSIKERALTVAAISVIYGLAASRGRSPFTLMKKTIVAGAVGTFFLIPQTFFPHANKRSQNIESTRNSV